MTEAVVVGVVWLAGVGVLRRKNVSRMRQAIAVAWMVGPQPESHLENQGRRVM